MANESTSNYEERLATLESQVKALARALADEKEKTAGLEQALDAYKQGLEQTLESYEKAFDQAARSYEPIIQRALNLSAKATPGKPQGEGAILPEGDDAEGDASTSTLSSMVSIVDDLPRVLAAIAIIISLITGGTSIASLIQSTTAQIEAQTARGASIIALDTAGAAKQDATEAKKDAETARGASITALDTAGTAKQDATEAKKDAETAKGTSETAVVISATAQAEANTAKQEAQTANEKADTAIDASINRQSTDQ